MQKKFFSVCLVLCLLTGITVSAENDDFSNPPEMPRQQGENRNRPENMPDDFRQNDMSDMENREKNGPPGDNRRQNPPEEPGNTNNGSNENQNESNTDFSEDNNNKMPNNDGMPPEIREHGEMQGETQQVSGFSSFLKNYSTPITAVVVLLFAYVFVIFYKRKHY